MLWLDALIVLAATVAISVFGAWLVRLLCNAVASLEGEEPLDALSASQALKRDSKALP